ncbi:hypothetical protein [Nocardioides sp. NPDC006273]|uniref:hypothetical protein n=1 Tax=Nocardioides sp. NPDC006273 TaxID=3155598 RepID=UPI0033A94F81
MEPSPKGRTIRPVDGEPGAISKRGTKIEELGDMMLNSALVLQNIADNALGGESMKGKAINALRDSIGDSHETLKQAGELYKPVGPVIKAYGDALEDVQPKIQTAVTEAQDKYSQYISLPGDKDDSQTEEEGGLLGIGGTDKEEAAENQAKAQAYQDFVEKATEFDTHYDTWENAFEAAANGIEDKTAGSIEDSAWSDWADVLKVVGTIVAIAALFTGIGALIWLGVAIGVAATAVTAMQMANGEANWGDLALAALTIIPVGKLGNLSRFGHGTKLGGVAAFKGMFSGSGAIGKPLLSIADDSIVGAWRSGGLSAVGKFLGTGSARGLTGVVDDNLRLYTTSQLSFGLAERVAHMGIVQGVSTGVGNLNSLNGWVGNLGMPNIKLPEAIDQGLGVVF